MWFWLIGVPLLVIGGLFAAVNRQVITLSFWPLNLDLDLPLFAALLVALFFGFVAGALFAARTSRKWRRLARQHEKQIATLERQVGLRGRQETKTPAASNDALPRLPAA